MMAIPEVIVDAWKWSSLVFGGVDLKDARRTSRAVETGARIVRNPGASLPGQMGKWSEVKGAYRLFDSDAVTHEALMTPHYQQTRETARKCPVVLMIQDTTEIDHTSHEKTSGLAQIGDCH